MMNYKKGDVVLIEFIFAERNKSKKRPALVISNVNYNNKRQEVIVLAITSNISIKLPGDTLISNWKEAGLLYPSKAACILQTIKKSLVLKKLGIISERDLKKIDNSILKIL
jgi:mRNA interferase MazF